MGRLSGYFASNRKARKARKGRQFDQLIIYIRRKCRERVVARVVCTLKQPFQPCDITVDLFTTAVVNAIEAETPPPPRHQRGWCESAETSAAFKAAWTAKENARKFWRAYPWDRIAWTTLRTACACLQQVVAAGIHAYFEECFAETERLLVNINR